MQKFSDIIERVEKIRHRLGLNKTRFAGAIEMSPQTYNNFIGAQGSKPNIELITGVVGLFKVNPYWLLNGTGEPFEEGVEPEKLGAEFGGRSSKWERLGDDAEEFRNLAFGNYSFTKKMQRLLHGYSQVDAVAAFRDVRDLLHRMQTRLGNL